MKIAEAKFASVNQRGDLAKRLASVRRRWLRSSRPSPPRSYTRAEARTTASKKRERKDLDKPVEVVFVIEDEETGAVATGNSNREAFEARGREAVTRESCKKRRRAPGQTASEADLPGGPTASTSSGGPAMGPRTVSKTCSTLFAYHRPRSQTDAIVFCLQTFDRPASAGSEAAPRRQEQAAPQWSGPSAVCGDLTAGPPRPVAVEEEQPEEAAAVSDVLLSI